MSWVADILDKVFTRIDYDLTEYDAYCSTENESVTPTKFPTVYVRELNPVETGQDLDNVDVNFVIYTIQVIVWAKSEELCKEIAYTVSDTMKKMRFNITAFPDIQTKDNISTAIIRFRRAIGEGDSL